MNNLEDYTLIKLIREQVPIYEFTKKLGLKPRPLRV
ncbi:hypothetical protein NIES22_54740 [Calothrix brevissima NIES-22]|nr:hypothetical protein NIES22_54740 [Calothrix brevissima NIES-22]